MTYGGAPFGPPLSNDYLHRVLMYYTVRLHDTVVRRVELGVLIVDLRRLDNSIRSQAERACTGLDYALNCVLRMLEI